MLTILIIVAGVVSSPIKKAENEGTRFREAKFVDSIDEFGDGNLGHQFRHVVL